MSRLGLLLAFAAGFTAALVGLVEGPDSLAFLALVAVVVGIGLVATDRADRHSIGARALRRGRGRARA